LNRRLPGYFLALFLPSAALITGAGVLIHRAQTTTQREVLQLRESTDTQHGAAELRDLVVRYAQDVQFIQRLPTVSAVLEDPSPEALARLEGMFVAALGGRREIHRVRWIDETGHERMRVSRSGETAAVTPARRLGDVSDRYYVAALRQLEAGQIYISPMDLSDHGPDEPADRLVVHVGTPLFDAAGRRRGMLLVSYDAKSMVAQIGDATQGVLGSAILLDGRGRWLYATGSRLGHAAMPRPGHAFATDRPEAWQRIAAASAGQFRDAAGIWTFDTVRPRAAVAAAFGPGGGHTTRLVQKGGEYEWKVVSLVPAGELGALMRPARDVVAATTLVLLLLSAGASALVARGWIRREQARLEQAERDARESAAALRLVLQSNPNPMMVIDRTGRIFEANPQAERVFGYGRDQLRRLGVEDLVPRAVRDRHAQHRRRYAEAAHARPMGQGLELAACRHDGSEFPVEISLAPLTLGGVAYVIATVVDISARKRSEAQVRDLNATLERRVTERTEELQRAESNLRLILESSAEGLFGVDPARRITFANTAASRMLGCAASTLVGRSAVELSEDVGPGRGLAWQLERTLGEGSSATVDDESYRCVDGQSLPVTYSTHPMVRGGRIVGAVVSFMDATERRALDRARESALHEAERLAQARSDFLANMSHEIRTPLNGILGLAQVAHREPSTEPATHETFGRILEAGRTLLGVVDNVLDFSRIEAGKVQVEAVALDVRRLVDEVLTSIVPVAEAKGVELRTEVSRAVPQRCVGDPMRIKQVLLNLLSNAVKFTGYGRVSLRVDRLDERLRFVVRDTGVGIDATQLSRIFSAFEQADTSTTRRFGGTGLGLSICKRIVDLLGGEISVQSELRVGSEFTVLLPCVEANPDAPVDGEAAGTSASGTRRVARLAGLRILFAEDNEVNQLVVQAMLRKEGPELVTVGDGRVAVERVLADGPGTYDLVLMDIQMPGMDGYEATRRIHAIDPDLPVVGQTAHVLHEAIEQCCAAGMVAHVPKPIDRHALIETIMRHARTPVTAPAAAEPAA
jgi:PAS domain S-box-containing protein